MIWFEAPLSLSYRDLGALEVLSIYLLKTMYCTLFSYVIKCHSFLFPGDLKRLLSEVLHKMYLYCLC